MTNRSHSIIKSFFFSGVLRFGFEIFLPILFACVYNLYNMENKEKENVYSTTVCFIWLFLLVWMKIIVFYFYFKHKKNYSEEVESQKRLGILVKDMKDNYKISILEHLMFMIRRIILSLLLVFRQNYGKQQLFIFFPCCLLVLMWKILIRPFKQTKINFWDITNEVILWVILGIFFNFKDIKTEKVLKGTPHTLGLICFIMIIIMTILNYMVLLYQWVSSYLNKKRKKNSKVHRFLADFYKIKKPTQVI